MKIAFACPRCAKQISADAALAGRTGRCRHCGQRLVVPDGRRMPGDEKDAAARRIAAARSRPADRADVPDWRTAVASQLKPQKQRANAATERPRGKPSAGVASGYSLRPVTPNAVPALELPDWGNAEIGEPVDLPELIPSPVSAPPAARAPNRQPTRSGPYEPSPVTIAYRWFFAHLVRITTWISETSYTVSFILIILAIASGMVGRHALAALATGTIVVLNLVGLAGDIASLVTLSFRRNPVQGTLFLVPPFTLYYLWSDWDRYRDTVGRMRIPLTTLAVVAAAYVFVPWLRGGTKGDGPLVASVKRVIGSVEEDLGRPKGAIDEGLKKARSWLREVPLPDPSTLPGMHGTDHSVPGHGHGP